MKKLFKSNYQASNLVPVSLILTLKGIEKLIDEVGGVTVHVNEDMEYDDYAGNLHINFQMGENHLDGEDLLKYVRYRNNSKGDIGRIARQQQVSKLLFDKIFRLKSLIISPKLMRIFFKSGKFVIFISLSLFLLKYQ